MTDWLDTHNFLTPEERAKLRSLDLDCPEAIRALDAPQIGSATGLSLGKVGRLLSAAGSPATPSQVSVRLETPALQSREERLRLALEAAATDPSKLGGLAELTDAVVLGTDAEPLGLQVNVTATLAMLAHVAATGASPGPTWRGLRIASVADLATPPTLCNPRTGVPLQEGRDSLTLVPWAELGIDGLRLAAYGYSIGVFDGYAEDRVHDLLKNDASMRSRLALRAQAAGVDLAGFNERVVWRPPGKAAGPAEPASSGRNPSSPPPSGNPWARLHNLLLALFSPEELRRFISFRVDGGLITSLPGPESTPTKLALATVELLRARGYVDAELRRNLVAERPRKANEINSVFDALGI